MTTKGRAISCKILLLALASLCVQLSRATATPKTNSPVKEQQRLVAAPPTQARKADARVEQVQVDARHVQVQVIQEDRKSPHDDAGLVSTSLSSALSANADDDDDISMIDETLGQHVGAQRSTGDGDRSGQINGSSVRRRLLRRQVGLFKLEGETSGNNSGNDEEESLAAAKTTAKTTSTHSTLNSLKCRVEKDFYLDFHEFEHYSCANCYDTVPVYLFWHKLAFKKETRIWLHDEQSNLRLLPNQTELVGSTFKSEATLKMWLACCESALECCKANAKYLPATRDPSGQLVDREESSTLGEPLTCPATWDGLSCWPVTKADSWAKQTCPDHAYVLHEFVPVCTGTVQKRCFANGSWFIRNQHEWSDYRDCRPEPLYATRMRLGGIWSIISAMFICPALVILNKLPNRHKSKRVKIMSNILLYLLINTLCTAAYKFGVINKIFSPGIDHSAMMEHEEPFQANWPSKLDQLLVSAKNQSALLNYHASDNQHQQQHSARDDYLQRDLQELASGNDNSVDPSVVSQQLAAFLAKLKRSFSANMDQTSGNGAGGSSLTALRKQKQQTSPPVIIICWFISNLIRITRSLSYAWMFTGAVYLCSILHFAPAEPPALYIKTLMILTNGFPMGIGAAYLIIRTYYEPSPLKLFIMYPYYYIINDNEKLDNLWKSELSCWILRAAHDNIEIIAEFPNYVFVALNAGLFMATLFIMCNISRPGSTRNDMSIRDYIRAAGTLVVLYGLHAVLLSVLPSAEGCLPTQLAYYAFNFVDGLQGMGVSYVFCYKTAEGKEVIHKWWLNVRGFGPNWRKVSCPPDGGAGSRRRSKGSVNCRNGNAGDHNSNSSNHGKKHKYNSYHNHSSRSDNSACNGREVTTELLEIDDSPVLDRPQSRFNTNYGEASRDII